MSTRGKPYNDSNYPLNFINLSSGNSRGGRIRDYFYFCFSVFSIFCLTMNIFFFFFAKQDLKKSHGRHRNALKDIRKGIFGDDSKTKFITKNVLENINMVLVELNKEGLKRGVRKRQEQGS